MKVTIQEAAQSMYLTLHAITVQAEAGKPLSKELLEHSQKVLARADHISKLKELIYA